MDRDEAIGLVEQGWRFEGVSFYVYETGYEVGQVVYREYNPNDGGHNFTTDLAEHDYLIEIGWDDEGIAFNAIEVVSQGSFL